VFGAFFSSVFESINPVFKALQHENNDLQKCSILLSSFFNRLIEIRNQNPFYGLLKASRELAKKWG
jgi:hypothetical protein